MSYYDKQTSKSCVICHSDFYQVLAVSTQRFIPSLLWRITPKCAAHSTLKVFSTSEIKQTHERERKKLFWQRCFSSATRSVAPHEINAMCRYTVNGYLETRVRWLLPSNYFHEGKNSQYIFSRICCEIAQGLGWGLANPLWIYSRREEHVSPHARTIRSQEDHCSTFYKITAVYIGLSAFHWKLIFGRLHQKIFRI